MGSFSIMHWLLVIGIILLFSGSKRIPDLAKALGLGIREFKKALREDEDEEKTTKLTLVDPDLVPLSQNESSFHPKAKIR